MTAKFNALADAELLERSHEDLLVCYRALRDHHVAETAALTKRDRSAILRMAGNIAGGTAQRDRNAGRQHCPRDRGRGGSMTTAAEFPAQTVRDLMDRDPDWLNTLTEIYKIRVMRDGSLVSLSAGV